MSDTSASSGLDIFVRVALFGAAVALLIVGSTWSTGYAWLPLFILAAGLLFVALRGQSIWDRWCGYLHFLAVIPLIVNGLGLCVSTCGGFSYYQHLFGLELVWVAAGLHLLVGASYVIKDIPPLFRITGSSLTIGGSVFFSFVLVSEGQFCGSCFGTHAVMFTLLSGFVAHSKFSIGSYATGWSLAGMGLLALWFHPKPYPEVQNDPTALTKYLQNVESFGGRWDEAYFSASREELVYVPRSFGGLNMRVPVAAAVATKEEIAESGIEHVVLPDDNAIPPASRQSVDTPQAPSTTSLAPVQNPVEPAKPSTAQQPRLAAPTSFKPRMGILGSPDAPAILVYYSNPECPVCSKQWAELASLRPLIDSGQLQLRLLIEASSPGGQVAQQMLYASTLYGFDALADAKKRLNIDKRSVADHGQSTLMAQSFYRAYDIDPSLFASEQGPEVDKMQKLTEQVIRSERVQGSPHLWLYKNGKGIADRQFPGFTSAAILRIAMERL